jgi:hypothetical protein
MPFSLRYLMGYDKKLCADILSAYALELMHSYNLRAKHLLGLHSVKEAHTGAVTIVRRFDSALRLNVHPHTLIIDGVYLQDRDPLVIYPFRPSHGYRCNLSFGTPTPIPTDRLNDMRAAGIHGRICLE